jgi:hypothetical protein
MASRTAGEASSVRSFVVRIFEGLVVESLMVENLVVVPGRDSDAAIIFMTIFGQASRTASKQMTVTRHTLKLLIRLIWE